MRDYGKISTSIWRSKRFRALPDEKSRLFYFYLHTCPHVNSIGCFVLPIGYAQTDLGWTEDEVRYAIDTLSIGYLVAFDTQNEVIRILDYLHHDPFQNQKHAQGAVKIALGLPDCQEKLNILNELASNKYAKNDPRLPEAIHTLSIRYRNPIDPPNPNPNPNPNPSGGAVDTSVGNSKSEAPNQERWSSPPPQSDDKVREFKKPLSEWQPRQATFDALILQGVPQLFIAEQILEFATYWEDRDLPQVSWDAKFMQRCLREWKRNGEGWRPNPNAATDKKSQREELREATTGGARNEW